MFGQTQPEAVSWSRQADPRGDEETKHISHAAVDLWIGRPRFDKDQTRVSVMVFNRGRKALGFGAPGIGLAVTTGAKTGTLTCRTLTSLKSDMSEQENQRITVDTARSAGENKEFTAVFAPATRPDNVEVVIQANRIFAAPYLFRIPFQMESEDPEVQTKVYDNKDGAATSEDRNIDVISSWTLPNVIDYCDSRTNAIQKFADRLEFSTHREADIAELRRAVSEHTRVLSRDLLLDVSWIMADDLYKAGDCLPRWTVHHREYVHASAGVFFQRFHREGFVLRYGIDLTYEQTNFGMQRPLYLLPELFAAAGLIYVCPEELSLCLMGNDGVGSAEFLKSYARYRTESRHAARELLRKCNDLGRSYVVLEIGDDRDLLQEIWSEPRTNVISVLRDEAPATGSKVKVSGPV